MEYSSDNEYVLKSDQNSES